MLVKVKLKKLSEILLKDSEINEFPNILAKFHHFFKIINFNYNIKKTTVIRKIITEKTSKNGLMILNLNLKNDF